MRKHTFLLNQLIMNDLNIDDIVVFKNSIKGIKMRVLDIDNNFNDNVKNLNESLIRVKIYFNRVKKFGVAIFSSSDLLLYQR